MVSPRTTYFFLLLPLIFLFSYRPFCGRGRSGTPKNFYWLSNFPRRPLSSNCRGHPISVWKIIRTGWEEVWNEEREDKVRRTGWPKVRGTYKQVPSHCVGHPVSLCGAVLRPIVSLRTKGKSFTVPRKTTVNPEVRGRLSSNNFVLTGHILSVTEFAGNSNFFVVVGCWVPSFMGLSCTSPSAPLRRSSWCLNTDKRESTTRAQTESSSTFSPPNGHSPS